MTCKIARRQVVFFNLVCSTGMCRFFCLREWGRKEGQQFYEGLALISQSMFKSDRYRNDLSNSDRHLRLI